MLNPLVRLRTLFMALLAGSVLAPVLASAHEEDSSSNTIYTMSNAVAGNELVSIVQNNDGTLRAGRRFATGGTGTGGGLGNQGGIVSDGEFLLAVNAGSNDVSVFKATEHGLRMVDRMPSGGVRPVSITVHQSLVYVLNAGSDSIAGFLMDQHGRLHVLAGSERGLSGAGTAPAQIQFTHNGNALVVTEKATNKIVSFAIDHRGLPGEIHAITAATPTPFGFAITKHNVAVVSEAVGGAPSASAISSYRVHDDGTMAVVDPSVGTTQTAACWVVLARNDRLAFTTNTGSGSISSYSVSRKGNLTLLEAVAGSTGAGPIDMAVSEDGDYVYALNSGAHSVMAFKIGPSGSLQSTGVVKGLPGSASGLAAL